MYTNNYLTYNEVVKYALDADKAVSIAFTEKWTSVLCVDHMRAHSYQHVHGITVEKENDKKLSQLNCSFLFFIHLKLELLTQFPASNEWKIFMKIDTSEIELFDELLASHKLFYQWQSI